MTDPQELKNRAVKKLKISATTLFGEIRASTLKDRAILKKLNEELEKAENEEPSKTDSCDFKG